MRSARVLATVLLLAAASCRFGEAPAGGGEEAPGPDTLPRARARRGVFRVTIDEVGMLRARDSVTIHAPYWGKLLKIVPEGTPVAAGEPVLWMDDEEQQRDLERRESDMLAATSELTKQEARRELQRRQTALDIAQSEANLRFEESRLQSAVKAEADARRQLEARLISEAAHDRTVDELRGAELSREKADLAHRRKLEEVRSQEKTLEVERQEAEQRHAQARLRLEEVQGRVAEAIVRAPAAGVVFYPKVQLRGAPESRKVRVGDQVHRWMGPLVELPDLATLEVRSQVDESLMSRVQPGLRAEIRVTALEGLTLSARVVKVGLLAVPRSQAEGSGFSGRPTEEAEQVVFPTTLELVDHDPRIQPGMTVAVSYVLEELPDAVSVPEDAVFGDDGAAVVFVARGADWSEQRVELGPSSGGRVVVTDGLDGDETLLLGDPRVAARGAGGSGRAA